MKLYELKKWELLNCNWEIMMFNWIDWAYCKWIDEKWEYTIWFSPWQEVVKDWSYYFIKE